MTSFQVTRDGFLPAVDLTKLWIVIPAFNERIAIEAVVTSLISAGYSRICVVDDGSEDDTASLAYRSGAFVLRHLVNLGQGAALQTGISYALRQGAHVICTFDADGQHSVTSLTQLIEKLVGERVDVVLGSRFIGRANTIPWRRKLLLKTALAFTRLHSGLGVTDTHNGLRAFTRKAAQLIEIEQPGMAHASEILQKIKISALTYREVPVEVLYSNYSMAKGQSGFEAARILLDLLYRSIALRP